MWKYAEDQAPKDGEMGLRFSGTGAVDYDPKESNDPISFSVPLTKGNLRAEFPSGSLYKAVELLVPGIMTKRSPEGTPAGSYNVPADERITFRLEKEKGDPLEFKLPFNSLDAQYLVDQVNAKEPFKNWSVGKLFRVPEKENVKMSEAGEELKTMDPNSITTAYNELVGLRQKAIDEQAKQLRAEGKNLQAFVLKNKDTLLSSGMGTAAGALGYLGSYAGLGFIPFMKRNKAVRLLASLLIGAGAGTAVGFGTNKYLTRYTKPKTKATYSDVLGAISNGGTELADLFGMKSE